MHRQSLWKKLKKQSYLLQRFISLFIRLYKILRYRNVSFGYATIISPKSTFEGNNYILHHTFFNGAIGYCSYIGSNCSINASIGRFCSIANNVKILVAKHPTSRFVSTYPGFYSINSNYSYCNKNTYKEHPVNLDESYPVVIGNDVYIGDGVTIIAPVKIGNGAIIGANAVVTKDVEPYNIVAGIPARPIKNRFTLEQIKQLETIKWWDKKDAWLMENAKFFNDIDVFLEKVRY